MKERNIKLIIAYDGTYFNGWQKQGTRDKGQGTREICPEAERLDNTSKTANNASLSPVPCPLSPNPKPYYRTVQREIETALEKMHKHPVNLTGSGRTDSGVHATGQVANFYTDIKSIPAEKFVPALNSLLPKDVRILDAAEVPAEFHARFSAVSRTYRYHFICSSRGSSFSCSKPAMPHESRYNLQLWRFPDLQLLNALGRLICGETDCAIFASAGDEAVKNGKSTNRYIYSARFFVNGQKLIFEICANAFLRNMVRSIAGTFLHYEELNTSVDEFAKIISSKNRSLAGPTLPPQGLFLWKVEY